MNRTFIKNILIIIENLSFESDYIVKVKYITFLISKILYYCKFKNLKLSDLANKDIANNIYFLDSSLDLFTEYEIFDLNNLHTQKIILNLLCENCNIISCENFSPANLYEQLLSTKEKKLLGQVYTPTDIVSSMLKDVFEIKKLNIDTKILDPACGGGYFLIESFKLIKKNYPHFSDKHIVENMLYGIDIDNFSIFLTKLGLLFYCNTHISKFNIFHCDFLFLNEKSLIKFDIIVGNPPYIGHKNTDKNYRTLLKESYKEVFYNKSDLSYCFFFKAKKFLKTDGVLSYITSRYFIEAMYADKLRNFIKENFEIISIIDYDGITLFKNIMISPLIILLKNSPINSENYFNYTKLSSYKNSNIKFLYHQKKLNKNGWVILDKKEEVLFKRIEEISNIYIKDICSIKQGIITGLDKAFIVDEFTIEKYNIEKTLLRKWIKNSDISKNNISFYNKYIIYTNIIEDESQYPNTIKYLEPYKEKLMNRRECIYGLRKWYELQWGRNKTDFENDKIIFPYKSSHNNFYYDKNIYFCSADIYLINNININLSYEYLTKYLNSSIFEFYFKCHTKKVGERIFEYYPNKLNNVKLYLPDENLHQIMLDLEKINIESFLKKVFNISDEEVNIIKKYI